MREISTENKSIRGVEEMANVICSEDWAIVAYCRSDKEDGGRRPLGRYQMAVHAWHADSSGDTKGQVQHWRALED